MLGEIVGNYRLTETLGKGGMGEVYVGVHTTIGAEVAIKLLRPELCADAEVLSRFLDEARAVARLRDRGVVQVFDVGTTPDGRAYLVMERLRGSSLAARLRGGSLGVTATRALGAQLALALAAAHAGGVIHRDLKPDNVFLVDDPLVVGGLRAVIIDFGVAKLANASAAGRASTHGALGTPAYMAPEQWADAGRVDARADLYALGALLFEAVAGRPPFVVTSFADACAQHLYQVPPRLRAVVPHADLDLDELIDALLAKGPGERPASAAVVAERLGAPRRAGLADPLAPTGFAASDPHAPSGGAPRPRVATDGPVAVGRPRSPTDPLAATGLTPPPRRPIHPPSSPSATPPPAPLPATAAADGAARPRGRRALVAVAAVVTVAAVGVGLAMMVSRASSSGGKPVAENPPRPPLVTLDASPAPAPNQVAAATVDAAVPPAGVVAASERPVKIEPTATTRPRSTDKTARPSTPLTVAEGDVDPSAVYAVVSANQSAIQACYLANRQGEFDGKQVVRAWLRLDGKLERIRVLGLTEALGACVEGVLSRARFPTPVGGPVELIIPLRFQAADASPDRPARAEVEAVMTSLRRPIAACAAQAPGVTAVSVYFQISPDGSVHDARIQGDGVVSEVRLCIERAALRARFPASRLGATTNYPFNLDGY